MSREALRAELRTRYQRKAEIYTRTRSDQDYKVAEQHLRWCLTEAEGDINWLRKDLKGAGADDLIDLLDAPPAA